MKKQSGFTLVELIIVIILLGILAVSASSRLLGLQGDAQIAGLQGLQSALKASSDIVYAKAILENATASGDTTLSSGIRIRYGYPYATQSNLAEVLDFTEDDWKLSGSAPEVTFTYEKQTSDLTVAEINGADICKLVYRHPNQGEQPTIEILGCDN
jgi:MSHA pilin protein MshA